MDPACGENVLTGVLFTLSEGRFTICGLKTGVPPPFGRVITPGLTGRVGPFEIGRKVGGFPVVTCPPGIGRSVGGLPGFTGPGDGNSADQSAADCRRG